MIDIMPILMLKSPTFVHCNSNGASGLEKGHQGQHGNAPDCQCVEGSIKAYVLVMPLTPAISS